MRFALALAAVAALWVQPAQAATIIWGAGQTAISGTVNGGPRSLPLRFATGGSYDIEIQFSAPVAIERLKRFQEAFWGECTPECEWSGDSSVLDDDDLPYSLDGNTLSFSVDFGWNEKIPFNGGYSQLYFSDRDVQLSLDAGSVPVSYSGFVTFVPEPATWALMLLGFGAVGAALRHQQKRRLLSV